MVHGCGHRAVQPTDLGEYPGAAGPREVVDEWARGVAENVGDFAKDARHLQAATVSSCRGLKLCLSSFIYIPFHGARRAMAAALPLPLADSGGFSN